MALSTKAKIGIGAGVLLLGGGIWAVIAYNKNKEERAGGAGSGSGTGSGSVTGAPVSPCVSRPASTECKKEKCSAIMATLGRGSGSSVTSAQITECKILMGMPLNPCEIRAGSNECIEWQKKQAVLAGQGRGADGISFA